MRLGVLIVLIVCGMLVVVALAVFGVADWAAASNLDARAGPPARILPVLAATAETVTLPLTSLTAIDGVFGLDWAEGEALLSGVAERAGQTVTWRIAKASAPLRAGMQVHWNKFAYRGDPLSAHGLAFEEVGVPGALGTLPAWLVPGTRGTWFVLMHGRRATRTETLRALPTLAAEGFPLLVMTCRNDAGAPASPDHRYHLGGTEWEDVEAGVRYALEHGAQDIALFGWSMGGCIVETFLHRSAHAGRVRAVVLDSPILNWRTVLDLQARGRHLPGWLAALIGRRVERRAGIDFAAFDYERPSGEPAVPTLLFHGTADTQVPVISSDRFAEARPDLVTYVRMEGIEHTQEWNADPQGYERALTTFLQGIAEG